MSEVTAVTVDKYGDGYSALLRYTPWFAGTIPRRITYFSEKVKGGIVISRTDSYEDEEGRRPVKSLPYDDIEAALRQCRDLLIEELKGMEDLKIKIYLTLDDFVESETTEMENSK